MSQQTRKVWVHPDEANGPAGINHRGLEVNDRLADPVATLGIKSGNDWRVVAVDRGWGKDSPWIAIVPVPVSPLPEVRP